MDGRLPMSLNPPVQPEILARVVLALIRSERAESTGWYNTPPVQVNAALIRTAGRLVSIERILGHRLTINSGYRSPRLNAYIGGAKDSQHVKGEAADFVCPDFGTPSEIVQTLAPLAEDLGIDQLILEPTWVHVSFAENPRHEILTKVGKTYVRSTSMNKPYLGGPI